MTKQRPRNYLDYDARVIPTHFPRLLIEVAGNQCADRQGLLADTGITSGILESPDTRFSLRQYSQLCRNALHLTGNSGLGIDLGLRVGPSNLGMLGLAAISSPDARSAVELGLRYYRLLAPFWDLSLEVTQAQAQIIMRQALPLQALHVFATEIMLVTFISMGRALFGEAAPLLCLELAYPKPPHARRYAEIIAAPIRFGRPVTRILLDASVLDRKLPSFDPATLRAAERQCEAGLAASGVTESVIVRVRRLLEASPGQYPTLPQLAEALQTSERTLRRDLVEMGTSYRSLLGIARSKHAMELLTSTDMSINDIAEHLGFSEGRALRRAFKLWTGRTAARYRADARPAKRNG